MIQKIAWEAFKKTGNINTFLELKQIENINNQKVKINEYSENEGNNNSRK